MRTKTIVKNVYKFEELSESAQDRAMQIVGGFNVEDEWWDSVKEDAENIGLKIKSFDIDRRRHCQGDLIVSPLDCVKRILKDHGEACDTYKLAKKFENYFVNFAEAEAKEDGDFDENLFHEIEDEFIDLLLEEYASMFQREFDYLTSREAILETIEANGYEFDENGSLA
jgi:hypothetical protein